MMESKDGVTRPHDEGRAVPGIRRRGERLVGVLVAGIVLLNFPLLSVFNFKQLVFGIPVLYVYLFSVWVLLIIVMALILRDRPEGPADASREKKE